MKILISNDDGIYAKGLQVLAETLSEIADVVVVAPDRNRSGASNSLTLANPIRVKEIKEGYFSVEGTPTDCVHLALTGLLEEAPDIVISGINEGPNLGDDVLYSGTVAAATEGRFLGLPAIALSLAGSECLHYQSAATIAKQLVQKLIKEPLPAQTILNVNVPDRPIEEIHGIEVARLGARHKAEPVIKAKDPRGHAIYWIGASGPTADAGPGTDFHAVGRGYVSLTPLSIDLTNYTLFEHVAGWVETTERKTSNSDKAEGKEIGETEQI